MSHLSQHHTAPDEQDPLYKKFIKCVSRTTDAAAWPLASHVEQNILCYSGDEVRQACQQADTREALKLEWLNALSSGPGIIAIKNALKDFDVIDQATALFTTIIDEEKAQAAGGGDHFAKPGANDRVWNAQQKHCLRDPQNFADYFSSEAIALICEAWLGDGYQVTAQVNRVNPGGSAQTPHRDYHLGFMSTERMKKFPAHVHALSPVLTLQGAIAHCDMPLETGPTQYLPYSQLFTHGYTHFNKPQYQAWFKDNYAQLPLNKGDAAFFNPAVMHGAGSNITTDQLRLANLLQISSAFGRAMEALDRAAMVKALYPVLLKSRNDSGHNSAPIIAASAEGYAFPTNLDTDPPTGGMSPETQAELFKRALSESWSEESFNKAIDEQQIKGKP